MRGCAVVWIREGWERDGDCGNGSGDRVLADVGGRNIFEVGFQNEYDVFHLVFIDPVFGYPFGFLHDDSCNLIVGGEGDSADGCSEVAVGVGRGLPHKPESSEPTGVGEGERAVHDV